MKMYMQRVIASAAILIVSLATAGCETGGQTGGLVGAGIGALAGQAIGGNTAGTVIGTAVGSGLGYVIGNEQDKEPPARRRRPRAGTTSVLV